MIQLEEEKKQTDTDTGTNANTDDFFKDFEEPVEKVTPPDDLLNEADQEQKDQGGDNQKNTNDYFSEAGDEEKEKQQQYSPEQIKKMNQRISKIIVNIWNQAQSFIFGYIIAQSNDTDKYMYDSDTIEQLSMLITDMMPEDRIKFGGTSMLIMMIGQKSLTNTYMAIEERKSGKQKKNQKKEPQLHYTKNETETDYFEDEAQEYNEKEHKEHKEEEKEE